MENFRKREIEFLNRKGYNVLVLDEEKFSIDGKYVKMVVNMNDDRAIIGIIEPSIRLEFLTGSLVDAVRSAEKLKEEFEDRKNYRESNRLKPDDYEEIASDMMDNIKEHIKDHNRGSLTVAGSSRYASVTADFTYNVQKGEILFVSLDNVECNFDDIDCEPLEIDTDELTAWIIDKIEDYNDRRYLYKECHGDLNEFFGVKESDFH